MVILLIGHQLHTVRIKQGIRGIALSQIVARLHLIVVMQTERRIVLTSVMGSHVKSLSGLRIVLQSDIGSRPCQIAGIIKLLGFRLRIISNLVTDKAKPFLCHL